MIAAALGSAVSTTVYGLVEDPTAQILARILWGISYASLNLSTLAYAVSDRANAGKRVGTSRAAIGLGGVFLHLDARLNFHRLFEDALGEHFTAGAIETRQREAMDAVGLTGHGGKAS